MNEYYNEISADEYLKSNKKISLNENDIKNLKKFLKLKFTIVTYIVNNLVFAQISEGHKNIIRIDKLTDDWYMITNITKVSPNLWRFYKCDQWDGLLHCINYIIYNK